MHRVAGTAIPAAVLVALVPGRAADPTADELLQAVEQKLKTVTETAGPSVACVVVSRSDRYPKPANPEHAGQLGGFDPQGFARADPTPTPIELARKLHPSDPANNPHHRSGGRTRDRPRRPRAHHLLRDRGGDQGVRPPPGREGVVCRHPRG